MLILLPIIAIAFIIFLVAFSPRRKHKIEQFVIEHIHPDKIDRPTEHFPYIKKSYLMTRAEYNFYKVLSEIVADKYYIIPQVALSKIFSVDDSEVYQKTYRNKIEKKSVDFVIFNKPAFSPVMIVELDDASHSQYEREIRDKFVDGIATRTGLKIVHVKTAYNYDINEVKGKLGI